MLTSKLLLAGKYKSKPFSQCVHPDVSELGRVSDKCRRALTACCKRPSLKAMPPTPQIALLLTLSSLANKRPVWAQDMAVELVQAADFVKTLSASLLA